MPKIVACIIVRTVSKRLPLKVLRDLYPYVSMIDFLIQRIKSVKEIDEVYICTSKEPADDILEDIAKRNGIKIYKGSADEVIERMVTVGEVEKADIILRITGDNPFTSIEYIPKQINFLIEQKLDYVRIVDVPIGATAEVINFEALKTCYKEIDPAISEYLMFFLFEPNNYKCGIIKVFDKDYSHYSLTVDTMPDLERTKQLLSLLNNKSADGIMLSDVIELYNDENIVFPAKTFYGSGTIKMPYDKVISFEEFQSDMERRKNTSFSLQLY